VTALPPAADKARAVEAMFDRIAPRYDRLNRVMTFGLDIRWRRAAVEYLRLPTASRVVDVGCGTGDFCVELAARSHFPIGLDMSAGMLDAARWQRTLVRADALHLPLRDESADGLTCGFTLRNLVAIEPFLAECHRVVRHNGRVALLEVAEPEAALVRHGHALYFRKIVPFVGGLLSDRAAYRYLPESTAYLPPPDELVRMVEDAGFIEVDHRTFGLGAVQLVTATR
jgi:demethylmenaquinone methyltransferase / 2-methoxy-6-polyprenyl-1,4-benzoquinol methylase